MMNDEDRRRHDKSWNDPPLYTMQQMHQASTHRPKRYAAPIAPEVAGTRRSSFPSASQQAMPMMQTAAQSYGQPGVMPAMQQQPPGNWGQPQAGYSQHQHQQGYGQQPQQSFPSYSSSAPATQSMQHMTQMPQPQQQGYQQTGYMQQQAAPAGNNWGQSNQGPQSVFQAPPPTASLYYGQQQQLNQEMGPTGGPYSQPGYGQPYGQ